MDIAYLDNRGLSVGTAVDRAIQHATSVSVAVAYSTRSGIRALEPGIEEVSARGGRTRLLSGLDDYLTDVESIGRVARLPGAECRVFLPKGAGSGGRFHPKLYVFDGERESSVIVGSANLTGQGLENNFEASIWLRSEPHDPLLSTVRESFELLWTSPRAVALTDGIRRDYERAKGARENALADVVQLDEYRRWTAALRANVARALVRPGSRRWLMITSPTNFEVCVKAGRWGDERQARIGQVQPGDGIIFYVTGEQTLGGIAIATGSARFSQERPWRDRAYPYQMDVHFISVAEPRPSIRPLIPELDLFGGIEQGWGQRLQTTLRSLTERDFGLLSRAIGTLQQPDIEAE